jgi:hypothetical protein
VNGWTRSQLNLSKYFLHETKSQANIHFVRRMLGLRATLVSQVGWDSVVDMATCYRMDSLGIGSPWGEIFCTHLDQPWGPPSLLYNGYGVSFPGLMQPRNGTNHLPHLSPRLKKEYGYTSTPPSLHGLFQGELYLMSTAK